MIAALVLGLVAAAAGDWTLDASAREELRVGTAVAIGGGKSPVGLEDAFNPTVAVLWTDRENTLSLRYDPDLLVPDLGQGNDLQVLHRAQVLDSWADRSGALRVSLSEEAQYGVIDLFGLTPSVGTGPAPPPGSPPPTLLTIPTVAGIKYVASTSLLDVRLVENRRTTMELSGGYLLSGGADAAAQANFPLEQGPYANLSVGQALSRRDTLTTRLAASDWSFSSGPRALLIEGLEEGRRLLSRHVVGSLALGYAETRHQQTVGGAAQLAGYPEVRAELLAQTLPLPNRSLLEAGLTGTLSPVVDRLSGEIYEAAQALGHAEWRGPSGLSFQGLAGFNHPLAGELTAAQQFELLRGSVGLQVQRALRLEAGAVGTWEQAAQGPAVSTQWLAFAAIVLQEQVRE